MHWDGRGILGLGLIIASVSALSQPEIEAQHDFSGFATVGIVANDHPDLTFRRDTTQGAGARKGDPSFTTDSLLGLQWQGQWSPSFATTVQVVAKERFDDDPEQYIEWAFARYRPFDGLDIRVGRLGTDVFMLSDYRQVGYAYPWVRPPHDFYGNLAQYHFDGIDLQHRFDLSAGTLNVKLFHGVMDNLYPGSVKGAPATDLELRQSGLTVSFEHGFWKWRYSHARVTMRNNIAPSLTQGLAAASPLWPEANNLSQQFNTNEKDIIYHSAGLLYDNYTWWFRAEAADLDSEATLAPRTLNYYLSAGRRFQDVTLFALHGDAKPDSDTPSLSPPTGYPAPIQQSLNALSTGAAMALQQSTIDQSSVGLGVRWDFRPKTALTFQVERFDVAAQGPTLWIREPGYMMTEDQTATVTSLALDVFF